MPMMDAEIQEIEKRKCQLQQVAPTLMEKYLDSCEEASAWQTTNYSKICDREYPTCEGTDLRSN